MAKANQMNIKCPQCGQPITALVESVIDVSQDPDAKIRLLSGRVNTVRCPNCGATSTIAAPMLYHDPGKELLIAFIPMELGLPKAEQEKVIGDLMRQLTSQLPQGGMKGYMFQPRQALTMQGLVDQILQADGVTPEMMEAQRQRVMLVEKFIEAQDDEVAGLVAEHDSEIDANFFQAMSVMAQRILQEGRPDVANFIVHRQQQIAEQSSYGQRLLEIGAQQEQIVREVAEAIQQLGPQAQRSDFLELAMQYAGDEDRLQALVGLIRPAFDYEFFQDLTMKIGEAPANERDNLEALRDQLLQLTAQVDKQIHAAMQNAAGLLQRIFSSGDPDEVIRANLHLIDDTFMAVLTANVQEAERRGDVNTASRLKNIHERVIGAIQENMRPELRFINDLLAAETEEQARAMIAEQAEALGPELLEAFDAIEEMLAARSEDNGAILDKLAFLRDEVAQVVS